MVYLQQQQKNGTGILLLRGLVLWTKTIFFVCWLDDCLIALKLSKNAPISKLFSFFYLRLIVTELRFMRVRTWHCTDFFHFHLFWLFLCISIYLSWHLRIPFYCGNHSSSVKHTIALDKTQNKTLQRLANSCRAKSSPEASKPFHLTSSTPQTWLQGHFECTFYLQQNM